MSTHANLGYSHIEQNQSGKEVTANAMADRIADALTDDFTQAVTGDFSIAAADFQANWRFRLTGTPASNFTMTVPARKRPFLVDNRTGSRHGHRRRGLHDRATGRQSPALRRRHRCARPGRQPGQRRRLPPGTAGRRRRAVPLRGDPALHPAGRSADLAGLGREPGHA